MTLKQLPIHQLHKIPVQDHSDKYSTTYTSLIQNFTIQYTHIMRSSSFAGLAFAITRASADQLNLYRSEGCRNAGLGVYSPVELGNCIPFDQARSYILQKNDGDVYNLYSGGGCGQYEGQVILSGSCLGVGDDVTGIMNIGKQDPRMIRGATREIRSKDIVIRDDGDAYQCPNVPSGAQYFFVVESSSATTEELFPEDEARMRDDFVSAFSGAYQNPSGQTEVSSFTAYDGDNIDDVTMVLDMTSGVIQDFQDQDMASLTRDLFYFRNQQRSPINFIVSVYSGRIGNVGGILATFGFRGGD
jgi:hypothetical protein